ncbi:MAG: NUDIX domain-containing protein [Burkholderiales bacterium]|nr:NUDIX domain-containing protein [Anaerolineae bacterium]
MIEKHKVLAYIMKGDKLLVFRHADYPQAGIQVPAGTVEDGESPEAAVMREAHEETGLENLRLVSFLGTDQRDLSNYGRDEIQQRYFFHVTCDDECPDAWSHVELNPNGEYKSVRFDLSWAAIDDVPELAGDQGQMLHVLRGATGWHE